MTPPLARRLLIIGWDAADWLIIDRLIAAGQMPALKKLIDGGVRADLTTLEPKLSPLLWTSIATGKTPDKHGILNFVEPKPDGSGLQVSTSTSRSTKALWNILSQSGLRTRVVGWYATHPAEPIAGGVVSNVVQEGEPSKSSAPWPLAPAAVSPESQRDHIASLRQRTSTFSEKTLRTLLPAAASLGSNNARVATLSKLMSYATTIRQVGVDALRDRDSWDCAMIFFDAIDTVGHHFMQFAPPRMSHVSEKELKQFGSVMDRVYEWHDNALADLLDAAGSDTTVVLLSDHGFHSDHLRPHLGDVPPERRAELESSWHRPLGILVMSGGGIRTQANPSHPNILDITPTALTLLGLPAGEDMDGRVLAESLATDTIPTRIPSWDSVDGDAGLHPAEARLNAYEAADAIAQLIDLGYMAPLTDDVQGQLDLVRRESLFNLGVVQMGKHQFDKAIDTFQSLTTDRPTDARYSICLARCLASLFRTADASRVLRALLVHDPANIESRLLLASVFALTAKVGDPMSISTHQWAAVLHDKNRQRVESAHHRAEAVRLQSLVPIPDVADPHGPVAFVLAHQLDPL
ncbi:MAG: alkaline phosphatase family protein [Planctomycetota bacterium]|nr:alkaline phosphatase family protein [Planctomycetota bacterium]